ncbi:MAG: hypothetical protein ABSG64_06960 [Solirubrobacteraceae bacterium]
MLTGLGVASLTQSPAPDFTLTGSGADWVPFVVISRTGGKWHEVPFDYASGLTDLIDERTVSGRLVEAEANASGGAAGPETYAWYRFSGRIFVPTVPPGPAPACSAAALDRAPSLRPYGLPISLEPYLVPSFVVSRFACADGWALATGVSHGETDLALFEQQGDGWSRDAVGSPQEVSIAAGEAALAESVYLRLARPIGQRVPRPHEGFSPSVWPAEPRAPGRMAASLPFTPGSSFATTYDSGAYGSPPARWFAVAVGAPPSAAGRSSALVVRIFHRSGTTWAKQATIGFAVTTPGPEGPATISTAALTGSPAPDFELTPQSSPRWLAVISDAGGHWHAVPFRSGRELSQTIDASDLGSAYFGPTLEAFANADLIVTYRFDHGEFVRTGHGQPIPDCAPGVLDRLVPRGVQFTRSACAYGEALAVGWQRRRRVFDVFSEDGQRWYESDIVTPLSELGSASADNLIPQWVLAPLERRVLSGAAPAT